MTDPKFKRLEGVVSDKVIAAMRKASAELTAANVPHAVIGGLAIGAYGYPRATADVDFLVSDEAFIKHAGGLVTLRVPIVSIDGVLVDLVSFPDEPLLTGEVSAPRADDGVPIVSEGALVHLKLKANRQKDTADVVELLKRGALDIESVDAHLSANVPDPAIWKRWTCAKRTARKEA